MTDRFAAFLALAFLATGCRASHSRGADSAAAAKDVDSTAGAVAAADTTSPPSSPSADSIPMDVSLTVSGAPGGNGAYHATGNGSECSYNPAATPRPPDTEWKVLYAKQDDPGVHSVLLNLGKTTNGATDQMYLMLSAGMITAGGMTVPPMYSIGTFKSGSVEGQGTAKVTRVGDGVRIDFDGVAATYKARIKMTVICKRLSH